MATNSLVDFLRERKAELESGKLDPKQIHEEWLRALDELADKLQACLATPIAEALLTFERGPELRISEEALGTYGVPTWHIVAAGHRVSVVPVARIIMGATGRVDLVYGPRTRMLLRLSNGTWKVVGPGPLERDEPLSEGALGDAVCELLQGIEEGRLPGAVRADEQVDAAELLAICRDLRMCEGEEVRDPHAVDAQASTCR